MANEEKKDFNAMLRNSRDMPRVQRIEDAASIAKYGGERMLLAPPMAYDEIMRRVPCGRLITVGEIRGYLARQVGADFTDPITAGIFVSIAAWASHQRNGVDETPWWRTLKTGGELNEKYPGGVERQKQKLEAEGHTIVQRGRTRLRWYVENYADKLYVP